MKMKMAKFNQNINFGNTINGSINCISGNNIVIVNGRIINGTITSLNGVSMKQGERTFHCTGEGAGTEIFRLPKTNNCSEIFITADDSVDRITAEVKAVCYAPTKEQADEALENFKVRMADDGFICSVEEISTCSDEAFVSILTEYSVKVPKSVNEIDIKQSSANVTVKGLRGAVKLKTSTGNITVTECSLEKYSSKIKTSTGNIEFIGNTVNHTVEIKSSTGNVKLSVNGGKNGDIFVKTSTGNICFLNSEFEVFDRTEKMKESVFAKINGCNVEATAVCGKIKR